MAAILRKTIVLVGMMGAGKTAVGRALATHLRVAFRDSDAEIETAANMAIAEIFVRDGEPFFRARESQIIARLLEAAPSVLSTGGGVFLAPENRAVISARGVSVWLDADLDILWSRVRHKDTRPLLSGPDPKANLERIYADRVPIYRMADLTIPAQPVVSIEDMARRVVSTLASRPDVLEPA